MKNQNVDKYSLIVDKILYGKNYGEGLKYFTPTQKNTLPSK